MARSEPISKKLKTGSMSLSKDKLVSDGSAVGEMSDGESVVSQLLSALGRRKKKPAPISVLAETLDDKDSRGRYAAKVFRSEDEWKAIESYKSAPDTGESIPYAARVGIIDIPNKKLAESRPKLYKKKAKLAAKFVKKCHKLGILTFENRKNLYIQTPLGHKKRKSKKRSRSGRHRHSRGSSRRHKSRGRGRSSYRSYKRNSSYRYRDYGRVRDGYISRSRYGRGWY